MTRARPADLYREWKAEPSFGSGGNTGVQAQREDETKASFASQLLASKCQRVIWDFAVEHRIPVNDAKVLLLDCGLKEQRVTN